MARLTKTQLIKLQKQLKTDQAIGDQFGITGQAIHQLRKKFDIPSSTSKNHKEISKSLPSTTKAKKSKTSQLNSTSQYHKPTESSKKTLNQKD